MPILEKAKIVGEEKGECEAGGNELLSNYLQGMVNLYFCIVNSFDASKKDNGVGMPYDKIPDMLGRGMTFLKRWLNLRMCSFVWK